MVTLDSSIAPDQFAKYVHAFSALQNTPPSRDNVILLPGSSVVKQFLFKTRKWLLFTPFRHKMVIQIRYISDTVTNHETIPYDLDIRAAIGATVIGGALGGFLGSLGRASTPIDLTNSLSLFSALLSGLFAIITVVALARKSDVQPIVSVEDFLGGFLLGFVVGYTGNALFEQVIQGFGSQSPTP